MAGFFDVLKQPPIPLGESYPLFTRISIETSSNCNRSCPFCPVSSGRRDFKAKQMDAGVFAKIGEELGQLEFDGVAQMFLLNEPLLDPQFKQKVAFIRSHCPKCTIYVSTNGDTLGKDYKKAAVKLVEYYAAGVTVFNINIYDSGDQQAERYYTLLEELKVFHDVEETENKYRRHRPKGRFACVTDMRLDRIKKNASLTDSFHLRGDAEKDDHSQFVVDQNIGKTTKQPTYCARTQRHIVVRWDGAVPICCAVDPTDEKLPIMGRLQDQSLSKIWNSEAMFMYRWHTQQGSRELNGCKNCFHRMAYPHVVRKVTADDETLARWTHSKRISIPSIDDDHDME